MRKRYIIIILIITIIIEIIASFIFISNVTINKNDTVKINELVNEIEINYSNEEKYPDYFEYSIIDNNKNLVYKTANANSKSINEAIQNGDIIIDLNINNNQYKLLINDSFNKSINDYKLAFIITTIVISLIQLSSFIIYFIYLHLAIIKPFADMKSFATRVAQGNLDIPLNMDKGQNFGAFTESFDIMRSELKKAKLAEANAEKSKRELVARLSHDIKTPVSSIKSISEVGELTSKDKERFKQINIKADQINTLVNNLFTITIEELDKISVNPIKVSSYILKDLIKNSDYLNKVKACNIIDTDIYADRLRLQQIIDNIIANSYKYANTEIEINSSIENEYLLLSIKDFGDSINDNEIPLLLEKYKRGSNILDKDGAGLGLYICKTFIEEMNGKIEIKNDNPGFKVILYLRII